MHVDKRQSSQNLILTESRLRHHACTIERACSPATANSGVPPSGKVNERPRLSRVLPKPRSAKPKGVQRRNPGSAIFISLSLSSQTPWPSFSEAPFGTTPPQLRPSASHSPPAALSRDPFLLTPCSQILRQRRSMRATGSTGSASGPCVVADLAPRGWGGGIRAGGACAHATTPRTIKIECRACARAAGGVPAPTKPGREKMSSGKEGLGETRQIREKQGQRERACIEERLHVRCIN